MCWRQDSTILPLINRKTFKSKIYSVYNTEGEVYIMAGKTEGKNLYCVGIPAAKEVVEDYYNERVPVMLLRDNSKYKDDVTVTVNGTNFQIKRGVQVMVPRCVALVLERSHKQEMDAQSFVDSLLRA